MTTEQRADYRIISRGRLEFESLEIGVPITITAIDALTKEPSEFTVLPIGKYEGPMASVFFRYMGGNFNFNLFGSIDQPFQPREGDMMTATSSGHFVIRLDSNHHNKNEIHIGEHLDLGFEYSDGDDRRFLAAHDISMVSFGPKMNIEGLKPADLEIFFQELKNTNRI